MSLAQYSDCVVLDCRRKSQLTAPCVQSVTTRTRLLWNLLLRNQLLWKLLPWAPLSR